MAISKADYRAFSATVREITEYCQDNPNASPINVVYYFREALRKLFRANPNFDEDAFVNACRRYPKGHTPSPVPQKPVDRTLPDEFD